MSELTAYCVKCRETRAISQAEAVFTSAGKPGTRGVCAVCGTGLYRMGATEAHAGLTPPEPAPRSSRKSAARKTAGRKSAGRSGSTRKTGSGKKAPARKSASQGVAKINPPAYTGPRKGKLVIVESPAKARTIEGYLGKDYRVRASVGHVRDLLKSRLSVDVLRDFAPEYRVPNEKRELLRELSLAVAQAEEIYLATDPDREGESIAWHLREAIGIPEDRSKRVVFYEVTKDAVKEAFAAPREIDMDLVNAQQARRILDRLVGYELSPLLWDKVAPRLSAGRVQSVAVRLVVEREREIEAFVPEEYWLIDAELARQVERNLARRLSFTARLVKINGKEPELPSVGVVEPILEELERSEWQVKDVKKGQRQRRPGPPFTTSTLQQEAARRLGYSATRTMKVAQQLYEGVNIGTGGTQGLITYMRTDSTNISEKARDEAAAFIRDTYGANYLPKSPNVYGKKSKNAQEAHEAIRPTSAFRTPEQLKSHLKPEQYRLYQLIWQRFMASQMAAAIYDTLRVDVLAGLPGGPRAYEFRANGATLRFPGFLAVYSDFEQGDDTESEGGLGAVFPDLQAQDLLDLLKLIPEQRFTQPPPRFTEASLVKALEENGIGRPSTYATILSTIVDRGYVRREQKLLMPTETGLVVNDLLVAHFAEIVDLGFTARMEDELDDIANGDREWVPVLKEFYGPFKQDVDKARSEAPRTRIKAAVEETGRACPTCGKPLLIRNGRFGRFIGCSDYPNCRYTEPLLEKVGMACPACGQGEVVQRKTKKGRTFFGCSRYPDCDFTSWRKPVPEPCPQCGGLLTVASRFKAKCEKCGTEVNLKSLASQHEAASEVSA